MLQDVSSAPLRPSKSAPSSPLKPTTMLRTRSESFHVTHKVPVGDTPYVRAKNVQLVDKDPEKAIPLFWAAINAGDRVDSALKDMAIVMKQQNRSEEAIEAIKSLRSRCSDQAQESLDNILLDLYKRCGRLDDQVALLRHKLFLIKQGVAFNGKRTKTARSQGKKFQVSVEQEATRLLGNLGWALMQQNNYVEAEDAYRRALLIAADNNKMCNLGICLMKQGRIGEAKDTLRRVKPAVAEGPRGGDSHLKAFERAQQMLHDLESAMMMNKGGDRVEQRRLFDAFLATSSIWQPQPCHDPNFTAAAPTMPVATTANAIKFQDEFPDENVVASKQTLLRQGTVLPPLGNNSLNIDARPFVSSKFIMDQARSQLLHHDTLKRTRSGNSANPLLRKTLGENDLDLETGDEWAGLLPDTKDFEEAIIAAVLGPEKETGKTVAEMEIGGGSNSSGSVAGGGLEQRQMDKRLKVFRDITLSLSPRV